MNTKQIKRLKELLGKSSDSSFSEPEKQELLNLKSLATANGFDPETGEPEADETMTASEARKMINEEASKAVTSALTAIGLDQGTITAIKDGIDSSKSLTVDAVKQIVEDAAGANVDTAELVKAVKEKIEAGKGVSSEELTKALKDFAETHLKTPSRIEFPTHMDFPVEHRGGNMTVAQKQLLNICLMHASPDALAQSNGGKGIARPTSMNDGLKDDQLSHAKRLGEMQLKSLRANALRGKALTAGGAGSGAELVPTDLSSDLMSRLYLESLVAAEFLASEIDMPSDPYQMPLRTTRTAFYVGSENPGSDPTESTPGTAAPTLTSAKLIGRAVYSYEADEDSIIAILPMLQQDMGEGAADALEGAFINGDTTATHQDSDIHAVAGHHAKLFKGLRKYAIAGSLATSLSSGGISTANIGALIKSMGKYGVRPRDLLIIAGVNGYNDIVNLAETLTADKVGSDRARILTGEAPSLRGVRVIVSSQVREDLNASGVYDGTTTTKGSILIVNRSQFMVGTRRGFTVEVDRDISKQTNVVVASFRRAFQPKETPSSTVKSVVLGYNYTA